MKKIAIYGQYLQEDSLATIASVLTQLQLRDCDVYIEQDYVKLIDNQINLNATKTFASLDTSYDLMISIGGDGTILRAVSYIGKLNIPVMGINTGRLGFLATLQSEELELAFDLLFSKKYRLSKRSLITATSKHPENHLAPDNFALNEVTVSRQNTTSMIQIETHLNGELLTSYWADGLIVSTPTGSTGYSLSCGGPVITPDAKALVITPIAPHNLNARPLVIPDDTIITVKVMGRENEFLASLDNRIASYPDETEITLKKADFTIDLIELDHVSFIKTIRHKLLWGEDKRN
ncbi:inorganic polyphosphate/ATP-NAD kinase ppnK [Flavobacteria bacterium BBFL7]|nr:inorganic polyphosphate/ATP-NAD kinase ppnK [Flavobacteria bacterium BBFL7]